MYREQYDVELSEIENEADMGGEVRWHGLAQVTEPQEVDVILLKSNPYHVGVVMQPPYFLHNYLHDMPVRCRWDSIHYHNRVIGFYRLQPVESGGNVKP